ncbi:MAG TPA: type VI secretion system protein TssA [Rhodobacteraceae bacterium]|nr:type VI secretion system protein TssA [Paracoccaceae bacterium]
MEINVEALLLEYAGESACGDDLEYDPDFIELEAISKPKEEQQVGDSVLAGEDVDFSKVGSMALGILERSKDLRAAVFLAEACLHSDGFVPFERVLAYIRGVVERYWECVHPELDEDDDNDPTMRVNALRGLVGLDTVLRAVRRAPLTQSRAMGRFSLRDISIADGEISPGEGQDPIDHASISAAFQDTDDDTMTAIREAVSNAREHVKAITAVFDEKVGALGPDFSELDKALYKAEKAISSVLGGESGAEAPAAEEERAGVASVPNAQAGPVSGAINSRDDVIRMIDKICEYYARSEPSSPVPVLLQRGRRLVAADFVTIMKDMASEGMNQVRTIGGLEDDSY